VAPPNSRSPRAGSAGSLSGGGSRPGGGVTVSRPGRYLAVLAALIIVMLATIIGGTIAHPGSWHSKFKVGLGLDLSSGTSVTLLAVGPHGGVPNQTAMNQAIAILESRVNATGVTGATVQQQGQQYINVSIPGKSARQISPLLSAAVLEFRQVLLCTTLSPSPPSPQCVTGAHGPVAKAGLPSSGPTSTPTLPTPTPTPSPSGTKASTSPTPSPSRTAAGSGQVVRARQLAASPTPSPSPSGSRSRTPSASPSPSPSPSGSATIPAATLFVTGAPSMVSPATLALFKKVDCANPNWQQNVYGRDPSHWTDPKAQIVSCDKQGMKYVLGPAIVLGTWLTGENASLNQTNQWVVNFSLNGQGTRAFGAKTLQMNQAYYNAAGGFQTSVLNQFAIVLDGKIISAPTVQQPITTGQGLISGNFTKKSAGDLATVLKYGQLPVSFQNQQTQSVSAQLGASQLTAGLIAAAIGLALVVLYSLLYYRGLALVSVFSLATSALLTWLSVVLLTKYQGYTLSLAGVAGLIVAIGITADSFVVFFERLRDEVREGRSLRAAVERGWTRARRTILVSDTVSFLAALLLYIFAIGDVRGFAFTLGLTTLIDVVVVFLFTKPMVTLLARTKFYGDGRKWSGLDPARLGARSPWRGSRPATAASGAATAARTTPREA
jgi:preprotein translocase subunit SecD